MGSSLSKASSKDKFHDVVDNESLEFQPSQSKLLAFTVQSCKWEKAKRLFNINNDAFTVAKALNEKGVIPLIGCHVYGDNNSGGPQWCTFDNIKELFQKYASEVGDQGIFIFFFSGHGKCDEQGKFIGLVPEDYDGTANTRCITRNTFREWLKLSDCKAKYVLLIINSCYAGGFCNGNSSTLEPSKGPPDSDPPLVYCMFSSASKETSIAFHILGSSVYCYYLRKAISKVDFSQGSLPIKAISDHCSKNTHDITNILHTYTQKNGKLTHKVQTPNTMVTKLEHLSLIHQDQAEKVEVFTAEHEPPQLVKECLDWIEECKAESGSLYQLNNELWKDRCTVDTVLCFMLRSITCVQLSRMPCQQHATIATIAFFDTVYRVVADTLKKYSELKFEKSEYLMALEEYKDCLKEAGITKELETLHAS